MNELIKQLSKEIPYQWRVQSRNKGKTKAICTAYIDARDVMTLLDSSGAAWQSDFKEIAGFIFAGIGIEVDGKTYWKWDAGSRIENDSKDNMFEQAGKSSASDAFKRSAVQWGIGRFIYEIPPVTLPCDEFGNVVDDSGQRVWDLTKHINNRSSKKVKQPEKPSSPEPAELKKLDSKTYDAMVKAINDGKVDDVKAALPKYDLTLQQRTLLTTLINKK